MDVIGLGFIGKSVWGSVKVSGVSEDVVGPTSLERLGNSDFLPSALAFECPGSAPWLAFNASYAAHWGR